MTIPTTPTTMICAGCHRAIDPTFENVARDNFDQPWHTVCMVRSRRPQGINRREDAGPLWAWAVVTLLIPFVGLVAGIVYLFRNRIGPGLALLTEAVVLIAVYAVLLSSSQAATVPVALAHTQAPPQRAKAAVLKAAVTYALNYGGTTHVVTAPWRVYECRGGRHRTSCRWTVRVVAGEGRSASVMVSAQGVVRIEGGRVRVLTYDPDARRRRF